MEPYEIIASPFQAYLAAEGEAFPLIDAQPAGGWTLLGTNGNKNISEDGVTVAHEEDIEEFRMLGATGPLKASRVSEGLMISFTLHDISLEQYANALNFNTVTTNAPGVGVAGFKEINLYKGIQLPTRALLLRGVSPYGAGWNLQYEIPRVYPSAEAEVVYSKGEPAGLELTFTALIDLGAAAGEEFGRLVAQHAAAT